MAVGQTWTAIPSDVTNAYNPTDTSNIHPVEGYWINDDTITGNDFPNQHTRADGVTITGLQGYAGADYIYGRGGDDYIYGNAFNDVSPGADTGDHLYGEAGNDVIFGQGGDDELYGGNDNDELYGGVGDDTLYGQDGSNYIDGGVDVDTISYEGLSSGVEVFLNTLIARHDVFEDELHGIENVVGTEFDDLIVGDNVSNVIRSLGGNDTIDGGFGFDTIDGGTGTDRVSYTFYGGPLSIDLVTGLVAFPGNSALTEQLTSIENIETGGGNDTVTGDSAGNEIDGDLGNDLLFGRADIDRLVGGDGDDVLLGGLGADVLRGEAGNDRAQYHQASAGLRADLLAPQTNTGEAAGDTYFMIENLYGTRFSDVLLGDAGPNAIYGHLGNDVLYGRAGNDTLDGRAGNEILLGGPGSDRLDGGAGIDRAQYGQAAAGLRADLQSPGTNTGEAAGDTYVLVENLFGSRFDDVLLGNADANAIYGHLGNDVLHGRAGNDVLLGGRGRDRLDGGAGIDLAQYSQATAGLRADLQVPGTNTGEAAGDTYVLVESLFGSRFNDVLLGNADANAIRGHFGNDALAGRAGNDVLRGGAGSDVLNGRAGNDALFGDANADRFIFGAGGGRDSVRDFQDNADTLDLRSFGFGTAEDALDSAIERGNDVIFSFGGGDILTVSNVSEVQLTDDILVV